MFGIQNFMVCRGIDCSRNVVGASSARKRVSHVVVYDRVRDPSAPAPAPTPEGAFSLGGRVPTRLVEPVPAKLPVGMDIVGRPFDEPLLLRIASAYEAATKHRTPPPGFGPVERER